MSSGMKMNIVNLCFILLGGVLISIKYGVMIGMGAAFLALAATDWKAM